LAQNTLWLFLVRASSQLFLAVFSVLVARQLGAAGFGQLAWMLSVVGIANVVSTFGTDTLLIREIAWDRAAQAKLLASSVWLQLGISAVAIAAIYLLADKAAHLRPGSSQLVMVYSLALIPLAFYSVFSAALRGHERMDLFLLLNLAVSGSLLLGAVILAALNGGLETLVRALLAAQAIGAVLAGWLCYNRLPGFRLVWQASLAQMVLLVRAAWPLALLTALGMFYQRLGILLVAHFMDFASAGRFAAAARVVEAGKVIHFAALGALLPYLSSSATPGSIAIRDRLNRLTLFTLLAASATITLAINILARPIVLRLFGEPFQPSIEALRLLSWGLVPFSFAAWASVKLVANRQEWRCVLASGLALAATLLLGSTLIRQAGLNGACLAIVAGDTLLAGLYFILMRRRASEDGR
jgi:O-antigen/teichoic acid export membrane protein